MITLLIFIAVLAVLVLSHEFGHFIVARLSGMKVEEFGFGFPPRLCGVRRRSDGKRQIIWGNKNVVAAENEASAGFGTIYSFNWLPLGGFVKIKGEDGAGMHDSDSFSAKRWWQQSLVLAAGVVMNIVVAIILTSVGFGIGLPQSVDTWSDVSTIADRHIEIMDVLPGKPAALAGLEANDQIVSVGTLNNPRLHELQNFVDQHKNEPLAVVVKRGDSTITKTITPLLNTETGKGGIGVSIVEVGTVRYPWYRAIAEGTRTSFDSLGQIFIGFGLLIKGLFTGHGVGGEVSGPVGVAVMTGQVARMGFVYLLQFVVLLSLNLAVLNILPIPALDGGRLLFVLVRRLVRRSEAFKYEQAIHAIGFVLLIVLVIAVTLKDVAPFLSGLGNVIRKAI